MNISLTIVFTKQNILVAKKKDLLDLIKSKVIPEQYIEYYNSLPYRQGSTDVLPAPSFDEVCETEIDDNKNEEK